jgi:hypothetical protein
MVTKYSSYFLIYCTMKFGRTFADEFAGDYPRSLGTLPEPTQALLDKAEDIDTRSSSQKWADRASVSKREEDIAHAVAYLLGAIQLAKHLGDGIDDINQNRKAMLKADCWYGLMTRL